jgi:hypothetical protein
MKCGGKTKMPKFKISYGLFGDDEYVEIVEADSQEEAEQIAYDACMNVVESYVSYSAEPVDEDEEES